MHYQLHYVGCRVLYYESVPSRQGKSDRQQRNRTLTLVRPHAGGGGLCGGTLDDPDDDLDLEDVMISLLPRVR